ncbi:MAG: alpha-glucosidase AglA [Anaerolineae bacterium]
MTAIKLGVIGAGSATFSLGLVKDLCLTESLSGSQIVFEDVDEDRLEAVHGLAERYADELGADLTFESTLDLETSLEGADFVINTASVVSHEESVQRRRIGEEHGYYYGRVGAGEYFFRNTEFMMTVARQMEEICPDAWLIQSGNPVFEGCTKMTRDTDLNIIGLCHGHYGYHDICEIIGIDWREVTWEAPGLNHNIWMTHFLYKGEDAYPLVDEWIENEAEGYWAREDRAEQIDEIAARWRTGELARAWNIDLSRGAVHMYRMYGLLPIGDTARRGGWWYHKDFDAKLRWFGKPWGGQDTHLSWPLYVQNQQRKVDQIRALVDDPQAKVTDVVGATKTDEQQVPIIDALVNDNEGQFQVNVPNNGVLHGLPDDLVVEVPAVINQKGVRTMHVSQLPPKIMLEQIMPEWLNAERMLLAMETGDRSILLWELLDNHLTSSYDQAYETLEALLEQEGNEEMNAYFQWPENWGGGDKP